MDSTVKAFHHVEMLPDFSVSCRYKINLFEVLIIGRMKVAITKDGIRFYNREEYFSVYSDISQTWLLIKVGQSQPFHNH